MVLVCFDLRGCIIVLKLLLILLPSGDNLGRTKSELDTSKRLLEPLAMGAINTF